MTAPIYSIAERAPDAFPCWLFLPPENAALFMKSGWDKTTPAFCAADQLLMAGYTHWSPDAPRAPTETPGMNEAQRNTLYAATYDPTLRPGFTATPLTANGDAALAALRAVQDIQTFTRCWVDKDEELRAAKIVLEKFAPLLERHEGELRAKNDEMDRMCLTLTSQLADLAQLRADRDTLLADRERLDLLQSWERTLHWTWGFDEDGRIRVGHAAKGCDKSLSFPSIRDAIDDATKTLTARRSGDAQGQNLT